MAALNYPIAGPPKLSPGTTDGSVPIRRELRDLQDNFPDQFSLYVLGLEALMKRPATSDLSYYGIAGKSRIHGRPYRSWGGSKANNPRGWQGYCTHSSILFTTWHRPYLSLFEQNLYEEVNKVARTFPQATRARYVTAASTFRAPYWDWAANVPFGRPAFPSAVGEAEVNIITPTSNGQKVKYKNPLYSYRFNPLNPNGDDFRTLRTTPYDKWPNTLRFPTSISDVAATSQPRQVEASVRTQLSALQADVYVLLTDPSYKSLEAFSSNEWHQPTRRTRTSTLGSIEDLHGSIHVATGGNMGHMSQLQYSAFDPIFWLHHANVDRLFAIWQAINPDAYAINKEEPDGTFSIAAGSTANQDTPLAPFNDASGRKLWTSKTARRTEAFNYAYPETQRWNYRSDADYIDSVEEVVYQLYGRITQNFRAANIASPSTILSTAAAEVVKPVAEVVKPAVQPIVQAVAPGQKPLTENKKPEVPAPKPASTTTKSAAPASNGPPAAAEGAGFFGDIANRVKDAVFGHDNKTPQDGTRGGIDFESEIGKPGSEPVAQDTSYVEYICTLKGPKHILEQTYVVHVFLGEFEPATNTWSTQSALVGTFTVFGKGLTTGCEKCAVDAEAQLEVSGTVNLTPALIQSVEDGLLGSVQRENVIPWLRRNLHWRVTLADGTEKARDEVPHLKVGVVSTVVDLPVGRRPVFSGEYIIHTEVTEGRPAGLNPPAAGSATA